VLGMEESLSISRDWHSAALIIRRRLDKVRAHQKCEGLDSLGLGFLGVLVQPRE